MTSLVGGYKIKTMPLDPPPTEIIVTNNHDHNQFMICETRTHKRRLQQFKQSLKELQ